MLIELILTTTLNCLKPEIINNSNFSWNSFDQKTLNRAKIRCKQLYPKSPCLKKFIKVDEMDYQAICGVK